MASQQTCEENLQCHGNCYSIPGYKRDSIDITFSQIPLFRICNMHNIIMLALLLQVASLLLASAHDSTQADFIQQAVFKEKACLKSNETTLELERVLQQLSGSEEIAQEQLDMLSLVTRYAGTGYNLVRGNPEGDFNKGGVDPGIRTTNFIFTHTYAMRKKAFYRGRAMDVPDQVNFHMSQSCASSHTVQAYSGRKSYMKELERSVSVSGMNCMFMHVI